jgi:hypothetical protein
LKLPKVSQLETLVAVGYRSRAICPLARLTERQAKKVRHHGFTKAAPHGANFSLDVPMAVGPSLTGCQATQVIFMR